MSKFQKVIIILTSVLLIIVVALNSFKLFAVSYSYSGSETSNYQELTVEVHGYEWNPFVKNLTIRVPNKHFGKRITSVDFKGDLKLIRKVVVGKHIEGLHPIILNSMSNLKTIKVSPFNKNIRSINGMLYSKDKTTLRFCPPGKMVTTIKGPKELKIIGFFAFSNNEKIKKLNFPSGITTINDGAFSRCKALEIVDFSKCKNLYTFKDSLFSECENLKEVIFPENCMLESIPFAAFSFCSNLRSIIIPKCVKEIGSSAFGGCSSLEDVIFEEGNKLEKIGDYAFHECSIKSLDLPNSVTSIGAFSFSENSKLESINLPSNLRELGERAFINCTALREIKIPSLIENINIETFKNCTNLESVELPISLRTIESYAFVGCHSLKSVTLPEKTQTIQYGAFMNCTNLNKITINEKC